MDKTYGLNWLEIIRRSLGTIMSFGLGVLFLWFLTRIQLGLNWETLLSIIMCLFGLGTGGWLLQSVLVVLWQNPCIRLHERGVTLTTNQDEMEWDWDEFTSWSGKMVYHKMYGIITMYISSACTFFSDDKPTLTVNGLFKDAPIVAGTIILRTINLQVPKQIEAFQRGETLNFAAITLNKEGLREGSTFIPFDDITGASINEYYLWVFRKSQPKPTRFALDEKFRAPELLLAITNNLVQPPTS